MNCSCNLNRAHRRCPACIETIIGFFAVLLALTQLKKLKKIHPIAFIAVGAVVGIVLGM